MTTRSMDYAATSNSAGVVQLLPVNGAVPDILDSYNHTAIRYVIHKKIYDVIDMPRARA